MMCSPASLSSGSSGFGGSWATDGIAGIAWSAGCDMKCVTDGCEEGFPWMRSFVPACSISTSVTPSSATFSISSTISLKFKIATSGELGAKELLGARQLETCPPEISLGRRHQNDVVLRTDSGDERSVLLRDERELQDLSRVQLGVRNADRLDETAELGAHHIERDVSRIEPFDHDAIEADQADRQRPLDTVPD